jgi:hypothetical protein
MKVGRAVLVTGIISVALAVIASSCLALVPFYSGFLVSGSGPPQSTSANLLEVNGNWIVVLLVIPVILTVIGLLLILRAGRGYSGAKSVVWICPALLMVFCALSIFSIGLYYLPAAGAHLAFSVMATFGWKVPTS